MFELALPVQEMTLTQRASPESQVSRRVVARIPVDREVSLKPLPLHAMTLAKFYLLILYNPGVTSHIVRPEKNALQWEKIRVGNSPYARDNESRKQDNDEH